MTTMEKKTIKLKFSDKGYYVVKEPDKNLANLCQVFDEEIMEPNDPLTVNDIKSMVWRKTLKNAEADLKDFHCIGEYSRKTKLNYNDDRPVIFEHKVFARKGSYSFVEKENKNG